MALRFYNTLNRRKEDFTSIVPRKVRLYTCGPTVYNFAHIGNIRTFVFEDILRRTLKYRGYEVMQVMNLTDIDDKIIKGCKTQGVTLRELTDPFIAAFFADLDAIGIERAEHYPRATDYIDEMVVIVQKLVARGLAYQVNGDYYFKIAAFPLYGKLANLDLAGLKPGARIATDEYEKESVSDFALWKAWDEDDGAVFWETAIGKGRPGWHLECSAMSMKLLGETFDIHTGGVDNKFPHHENEIAQSEGATGKKFVNVWLHSEHLIVDGKKMSKSLGNFYTLRDILSKGYAAKAVRYLLMATHYRASLNFTFQGLEAATSAVTRYNDFIDNLELYTATNSDSGEGEAIIKRAESGFAEALDDDLNISGALGEVFDFVRDINRLRSEGKLSASEKALALELVGRFDKVLNLRATQKQARLTQSGDFVFTTDDAAVEALVRQRTEAKKNRDFATADQIRDRLSARGIILEDSAQGVRWKRKL